MKKDLYCVICGNLKENSYFPLCRKCTPHIYNKGCHPHQRARNRKKWKKNRAILIEKAGNKCEWCGSDKTPFSIHHPNGINARTYDHIWEKLINERVNKLLKDDLILREKLESRVKLEQKRILKQTIKELEKKAMKNQMKVCPSCLSNNISVRKTLLPRYRCGACKNEFSTPKNRTPQRYVKAIENKKNQLKSQNYSYISISPNVIFGPFYPIIYDDALATYKSVVQQLISNYEEMTEAVVICKRCHYAHNRGLILCEKCNENYRKPNFETCYQCYIKEIEANDPIARKIRSIFNASQQDLEYKLMESECVICDNWIGDSIEQLDVYLTGSNGENDSYIGVICAQCYEEYKVSNETRFIVKKN